MGARENKFQVSQELLKKKGKIVKHKISFCEIWSFRIFFFLSFFLSFFFSKFVFLGSHRNLLFGVIFFNLSHLEDSANFVLIYLSLQNLSKL